MNLYMKRIEVDGEIDFYIEEVKKKLELLISLRKKNRCLNNKILILKSKIKQKNLEIDKLNNINDNIKIEYNIILNIQ